jgi:hypothetical protein
MKLRKKTQFSGFLAIFHRAGDWPPLGLAALFDLVARRTTNHHCNRKKGHKHHNVSFHFNDFILCKYKIDPVISSQ